MKTSSKVLKLDDAIFAFQVYQSDFGGRVQDILDAWSANDLVFFTWHTGVAPIDANFTLALPHNVLQFITVLLGFGVGDAPEQGRLGFWTKSFLNSKPVLWRAPLEGKARARLSGLVLKQTNPRIRGVFKLKSFSRNEDPMSTRTQFIG